MPTEKILVRGKIYNPTSPSQWEYYTNGAFLMNALGRIEAVGEYPLLKQIQGITMTLDFSDYLILPGLIDVHTHLPQLPIRGKTAGTLLDWLNRYAFPVEEAFADTVYAESLSRLFFESLKANGTTTAMVYSSVHEASTNTAFEAAQYSGMRVIMGKVMMDQHAPQSLLENTKESILASERLAKSWHGENNDLIRYAFTPRFALSCSQELLEAAGDLHRRFPESYIQSHLSENLTEIEEVEKLYGNQYSYTQIYQHTGCLGPRTVMAHGIHLSSEELVLLLTSQTRIAHCPTSNFFLKSGFFNLPAFRKYHIPFALGSDIGGGPDLCLFRVMRAMDEMQLKNHGFVSPMEAIYQGTLGGAKVLSLEDETGNFQVGKSADFIVLNTQNLNCLETAEDQSIEEILSQLVYLGDSSQVIKTFIRGQEVYSKPEADFSTEFIKFQTHPPNVLQSPPLQTR